MRSAHGQGAAAAEMPPVLAAGRIHGIEGRVNRAAELIHTGCMTCGFFPVEVAFDEDSLGISIHDGLWYVTGLETEMFSTSYGRTYMRGAGYDLDYFITELTELADSRWPQLVFGRTEEIAMFLALDDPRLHALQEYVRQMRRTRNIMVCSDSEVRAYAGLPARSSETWTGEAVYGWFSHLVHARMEWSTNGAPLFDLLKPQYWMFQPEYSDETLCEYWLHRYLTMSDKVIRALDDKSVGAWCEPGMSLLKAAGLEDDKENTGLLFIPERPGLHPFYVEATSGEALAAMISPGRVLIFKYHIPSRLPDDDSAFRRSPMPAPLDVVAATKLTEEPA